MLKSVVIDKQAKHILVLEHQSHDAERIKKRFSESQHLVKVCLTAQDFYCWLEKLTPSVVVISLLVEDSNILQLIENAHNKHPNAKIALISEAKNTQLYTLVKRLIAEGINVAATLEKPFNLFELQRTFDQLLAEH